MANIRQISKIKTLELLKSLLLWVRGEFGPVGTMQLYFLHISQKAQQITSEINNI